MSNSNKLNSLTAKEAVKLITALMFTPFRTMPDGLLAWGLPMLFWGKPGVGKTAIIESIFQAWSLNLKVLSPAEEGEQGFGVVCVPQEATAEQRKLLNTLTLLSNPPPAWVLRILEGGGVFLDELGSTPPMLQAPCLAVVHAHRLGGYTFHRRTRIIGAANMVEDAAGGWDMAKALANRMGHWNWELDAEAWIDFMMNGVDTAGNTGDALKEEARVEALWPEYFAKAKLLFTSFIRANPNKLLECPSDENPAMAWASPRSVENATRAYAGCLLHNVGERLTDDAVAGFVGQTWIEEFAEYRAKADLPDPKEILDGKLDWKHEVERPDRTLAVLSGCTAFVCADTDAKMKIQRATKLWQIMGQVANNSPDMLVPSCRTILTRPANMWVYVKCPKESRPILSKVEPAMKSMGIVK